MCHQDTPLIWKLRRQIDDRIEPVLIEKGNDKGRTHPVPNLYLHG